MTVPIEILALSLTAIGTSLLGFLSLVCHLLLKINSTVQSMDKRQQLLDERYNALQRHDERNRADIEGLLQHQRRVHA